jgi:hypothetical protein
VHAGGLSKVLGWLRGVRVAAQESFPGEVKNEIPLILSNLKFEIWDLGFEV